MRRATHALGEFVVAFAGAHWRWRTLDVAALQAFQDARARAIVAYAAEHSPFYAHHWRGHVLAHWRTLPPVDKAHMMAHFDTFNTCGVAGDAALAVALAAEQTRDFSPTIDGTRTKGLTVGLSSGTSGYRGLFLVSPREQAMWAGVILARALHTLRPRHTRVAFFLRSHSNLYQQVHGALLHLRYFDLMTPLAEAVTALNAWQPHIIVGPPSLLDFLAAAQIARRLHVAPERLIAVAEVLEAQDAAQLTEVFGAPVHGVYQCTEGLIAVSCGQGTLHIQEDIVAVQCEPLPPEALPLGAAPTLPAARRCTPIVTDLWREAQPIVRYRLNDVIELGEGSCACGSPFRTIARIEGRCDDVCYFLGVGGDAADGKRRPFFPDTIRRMILLSGQAPGTPGGVASPILDYQAIQEHDGQLHIHLALDPAGGPHMRAAAMTAVKTSVQTTLARYGCRAPQLTIDTDLPLLPPGRKRRRVQRL